MTTSGQYARRQNWVGGKMSAKAADEDIRNLRTILRIGNLSLNTLTLSGQLLLPDGTASAPGLAFANATNYGLYRSGTQLILGTNGGRCIVMDNAGSIDFYTAAGGTYLGEMSGTVWFPGTDNAISLGRSANRWSDLRTVLATISGAATFNSTATFNAATSVANTDLQIAGNQVYPVLQIQQGTTTTAFTTTSTSFVDTGLSVSITPHFNTSKILIVATGTASQGNGASGYLTLSRGSTNLLDANYGGMGMVSNNNYQASLTFYDAPASTSAQTYKVQARTGNGTISTSFPSNSGLLGTPTAVITAVEYAQ